MNQFLKKIVHSLLIYSLALFLFGCGAPVRHMNSDVCLIKQGNSPKEVMTVLGVPNVKSETSTGELWTYYSAQKSALKRTPVMRMMFGTISYDVVYVTFANNMVSNCQYRYANVDEFKQSKIDLPKEEL